MCFCSTADWNLSLSAVHQTARDSSVERDRDKTDEDPGVPVEAVRRRAARSTAESRHCASNLRNVSQCELKMQLSSLFGHQLELQGGPAKVRPIYIFDGNI